MFFIHGNCKNYILSCPEQESLMSEQEEDFPGIPLAILFPDSEFTLLDSIEKKIKVVTAVADELGLKNVIPVRKRVEEEKGKYDFIVSRAVTEFPGFVKMTSKNIDKTGNNSLRNGIIYLKGGDLSDELAQFQEQG